MFENLKTEINNGLKVDLKIIENAERLVIPSKNDVILALIDGKVAGYISIGYIASNDFDKYYSKELDIILHTFKNQKEYDNFEEKDFNSLWDKCENRFFFSKDLEGNSKEKLLKLNQILNKPLDKKKYKTKKYKNCPDELKYHGEKLDFDDAKNITCNRFFVDFIRVQDDLFSAKKYMNTDIYRENLQGQGLGNLLYLAGALYLHEKYGVMLSSSGLQSEYAQHSWKMMIERNYPIVEKEFHSKKIARNNYFYGETKNTVSTRFFLDGKELKKELENNQDKFFKKSFNFEF